jgi:hypothetical protein
MERVDLTGRCGRRRWRRIAGRREMVPELRGWGWWRRGTVFGRGRSQGSQLVGRRGRSGEWDAYGHFRNGILLAPVTARLLCDGILPSGEGVNASVDAGADEVGDAVAAALERAEEVFEAVAFVAGEPGGDLAGGLIEDLVGEVADEFEPGFEAGEGVDGSVDVVAEVEALEGVIKLPVGTVEDVAVVDHLGDEADFEGVSGLASRSPRRARKKMAWRESALAHHLSKTRAPRKSGRLATLGRRESGMKS